MAVAWCINAYDCSWNLIRTLEQLQSSNIGVWVQYTAPNPLDDKKINYIKYTDKCGCTCTLSWENEILIYSTNWVIKNLSLTNDNTNERVIVKWNDIFGSNWLKTVVRYKTGSAPTSLTDWTLAVEETTKNQYATNGYWVSWLSDDTTYYFSVFGVDTDGTVINVQNGQIKTEFWYVPNANTLFFLKNDWDIKDYSSYNHTMNRKWTSAFATLSSWKKVLDLSWSNYIYSNQFTEANNKTTFTMHIWAKFKSVPSFDWSLWWWCWRNKNESSTYDRWWARFQRTDQWTRSQAWVLVWINSTAWLNVYRFINISTTDFVLFSVAINWWTYKVYRNWTLIWTQTWDTIRWWSSTWPRFQLWWAVHTDWTEWIQWIPVYIWESVLEDRTETDSQVLEFFNKTKSHYWL